MTTTMMATTDPRNGNSSGSNSKYTSPGTARPAAAAAAAANHDDIDPPPTERDRLVSVSLPPPSSSSSSSNFTGHNSETIDSTRSTKSSSAALQFFRQKLGLQGGNGIGHAVSASTRQRQQILKSRPSGVLGCHDDELLSGDLDVDDDDGDDEDDDDDVSDTNDDVDDDGGGGKNNNTNDGGLARRDSNVNLHRDEETGRKKRTKRQHRHHRHRSPRYEYDIVKGSGVKYVIMPWSKWYHRWWAITCAGAIVTAFFLPYQLAFQSTPGSISFHNPTDVLEVILNVVFTIDIIVCFHLATYQNEVLVFTKRQIRHVYVAESNMFYIDFIGVFPFEMVALWLTRNLHNSFNSGDSLLVYSLWRLPRFVRLHRLSKLNHMMQYDGHISLLGFTLLRNFAAVLLLTHIEACAMYYIARLDAFNEGTWLGPLVQEYDGLQRYVSTLYFCIVTFCTVGYGDYAPKNAAEKIVGSFFMILNIGVAAWIVGSVTMLVLKSDEEVNGYRDSLETLRQYGKMHDFDDSLMSKLKSQLRLTFQNREISDESVLKNFPSALRRRILRKLYLKPLMQTKLMEGVRQQFVDAFLSSCTVEIFSPGEQIIERGSILSDLFLLVGGIAEVTTSKSARRDHRTLKYNRTDSTLGLDDSVRESSRDTKLNRRKIEAGEFIGEIGFFTQSPQVESVICLTTCKTLTLTQSQYKNLENDHPGSAGRILDNLLAKVEEASMAVPLPEPLPFLRAGSAFIESRPHIDSSTLSLDTEDPMSVSYDYGATDTSSRDNDELIMQQKENLTAVTDLVKMHMSKQLDDQTTRLLFAASRGDTATISLMCDQGFDPNNSDYDNRTALMVASMKGNEKVVGMLLDYNADPNLTDMHGTTALLEAVKHGHEEIIDLLKRHGAIVAMEEKLEASVLCQAVFDGDNTLLRRLLRAGVNADAADYDKRTASHIAAAEGNLPALRTLTTYGANLEATDRWGNTCLIEAERLSSKTIVDFLKANMKK